MINRAELKRHAKSQLRGKWGLAVGSFIIVLLIEYALSFAAEVVGKNNTLHIVLSLISFAVSSALSIGMCKISLNYAFVDKQPELEDVFSGFQVTHKAFALFFLLTVIETIGLLLLIIPGIIFTFMFSQAFFILAEDNSKSIFQCMQESVAMMKGYKFQYFVLSLSFLGWVILGLIPLGIGILWVVPYMNVTFAAFYLNVKNNYYGNNAE